MMALCTTRIFLGVLFLLLSPALAQAQTSTPENHGGALHERQNQQSASAENSASQSGAGAQSNPQKPPAQPAQPAAPPPNGQNTDSSQGKQTKRILGIAPNFTAVDADAQLPPLSAREKFTLAMHDSMDYSSFIWAGILAAQAEASNSYPELHHGVAGYGRYYWRGFVDQASGAFFTEAIVPALTHEDPRYFTRFHGSILHRVGYALTQVVITRTDSGGRSFNASEVVGNALEAAMANAYYPPEERGLRHTAENFATGIESAALNNLVKEFWPDINHFLFHRKEKQ